MTTPRQSLSLALIGSGGAGVMTAGQVLLDAAAGHGLYGLMTRSTGPQIRGGEAAAILRLGSRPVACQDDALDLLVALDFNQAERFASELVLDGNSLVIADPAEGPPPDWILASGARHIDVPFAELAKRERGVRVNTIAIGLVSALVGLSRDAAANALNQLFEAKGSRLVEAAGQGLALGLAAAADITAPSLVLAGGKPAKRWLLTGNEATAFGSLAGGVRFCAAYPITPSTEIQEWLASALPQVGGALVQAEDELASINMCIGASFGGVPAMTATSGPGLSLMVEALGLATAAEIPLLVANVMRGGPSTGIPTKSEQSDLNLALFGAHGDAPRLVLAPTDLSDCAPTAHWAIGLAEQLQCPAILLSDQFLGQARGIIDPPELPPGLGERRRADDNPPDYRRFQATDDGVSAMGIPGTPGAAYTATGLSHQASGRPSTLAADHLEQLDKRRRKLEDFDYGQRWADIEGDGPTAVICFGSVSAVCREAVQRLQAAGKEVRLIALRLLAPLRVDDLNAALAAVDQALVIEQNHSAQLLHYLRARLDRPQRLRSLARPGPLGFRPCEIIQAIDALQDKEAA
ncbi:MAG: 2-oxoacid:acceptor oxidoreductase subunit alpha [Wenzhouxiangella sp.]|nr:MAG: 2-oxoacid:acceptor oxidoreductase subunit alpha [Wenzhouxiangella sp.]